MKSSHDIYRIVRSSLLLNVLFVVLLPCRLFADSVAGSDLTSSGRDLSINGYFSAKYVYRTAETNDTRFTDQDIFGELRIDATTPKDNKYEFHFFGTLRDDLDGQSSGATFDPLKDIGNTYQSHAHGYLYEAHLDINNPFPHVAQVRLGRQSGTRDEPVFFDGAAADINAASKLNLTLYGGVAVHLYEIGYHWGDDALAGAGLDYSPVRSTKISLDYLSVSDARSYSPVTTERDQMTSLKIWQSFSDLTKASVKYRYLNSEPRDLSLRALSSFPEADTEVNINYFRQFRVQNELTNELALYYDILGQSSPYQSYDVKARKLFGSHYAVDIGYFKRALLDDDQKSAFDQDYNRAFLLFELIDLPMDGLSFTLIAERWKTTGRDYYSAGLDMGYAFKSVKNARISAGTYYSLYKYDYYIEPGVRQNVRTYYVNGRYPLGRSLSINGSYEYEHSLENYQTLKLGMRYDF